MHEIQSKSVPSVDIKQVKCIHGFEAIQRDYPVYLTDESKLSAKPFDYLWFPKDELELAAVIREMSRLNIPITIAGARTGLVGGSVPQAGAMISLEYLDQVEGLFYDPLAEEWRLRAQTSLSLKAIDNMLQFKQFPGLEKHPDEWVRAVIM